MDNKASKFVKTDEVTSLFDSLIQKENDSKLSIFPSCVFHPSHLTECHRRIIYRANGCKHNLNSYLVTIDDNFTIKKWVEYFSKCKSIKMVGSNVVVADGHYNISGNVDTILNINDCNYVIKIQPVCEDNFEQINTKGAIKKHVVELIVYMWLTELKDGILLYENKNTNKYVVFHIKPYDPIIKAVLKKCLALMENKIQGILPERPYKVVDANECKLCEFSKQCWG